MLRYATEGVIIANKGKVPEIFSNVYKISSLFIGCTKANIKHIIKLGTWQCIPCARGTYTLKNGLLKTSTHFQSEKVIAYENASFNCFDCPVRGNCTASIKSKSNFYGYKTKQRKVKFLPCPAGFCCTGNQCHIITSCNKKRIGTLCGRCINSHTESFLSANCISVCSCQNVSKFWLLYCIYTFTMSTFMYYLKDSVSLMKTIGSNVCKIFKFCRKVEESETEIDEIIYIVEAEEESDSMSHFTASGIFALVVSLYQIKQLMRVDAHCKNSNNISFTAFISNFLNLEIVAVTYAS